MPGITVAGWSTDQWSSCSFPPGLVWPCWRRGEDRPIAPISGKGLAGLIDLVRRGQLQVARHVVFIHTGGSAGLFGYGKQPHTETVLDGIRARARFRLQPEKSRTALAEYSQSRFLTACFVHPVMRQCRNLDRAELRKSSPRRFAARDDGGLRPG